MRTKTKMFLTGFVCLLFMFSCSSDELQDNIKSKELPENSGELITLKSGAIVEYKNGNYYWGGDDIVLSEAQLKVLDETGDIIDTAPENVIEDTTTPLSPATGYRFLPQEVSSRAHAAYPTPYNLWAMVRFTYAKQGTGTTLDATTKSYIQQALRYWEANTNVRFYNATDQPTRDPVYGFDYPYVNFCDGPNNQSNVGRIGGRQDLMLVKGGCSVGTVIHEIGHAIGLLHEHQRYDRDNYIVVNSNNIKSDKMHNFTKRTTNYYCIGGLEFESIMMYSSYTGFEIGSGPSMTKRSDGSTWWAQRSRLTNQDRIFPNAYYLPYIARSDVYSELAETVYKQDGTIMTPSERLQLQAQLNNGNPNPPAGGRIPNNF